MSTTIGYIKLHRQMMDWEWYRDANVARVFLHLLLTAAWQPETFRNIKIAPGQTVTTVVQLSEELGLTYKQVRSAVEKLIATGEIERKNNNHWQIITLRNYGLYQCGENQQTGKTKGKSNGKSKSKTKGQTGNADFIPENKGFLVTQEPGEGKPEGKPEGKQKGNPEGKQTADIILNKNIRIKEDKETTTTPLPPSEPSQPEKPSVVVVDAPNVIQFPLSEPPTDEQPENQPAQEYANAIVQRLVKTGAFTDIAAEAFYAKHPAIRIEYALQALEIAIENGKNIRTPAGYFHAAFREWLPGKPMPREEQARESAIDPEQEKIRQGFETFMKNNTKPREDEAVVKERYRQLRKEFDQYMNRDNPNFGKEKAQ